MNETNFEKHDWDAIETELKMYMNKPENIPPRIEQAMKDFPTWRYYTDSQRGTHMYRVLGVYPPNDIEDEFFDINLIAAEITPDDFEHIGVTVFPIQHFTLINEWTPVHLITLKKHKHGKVFAKPTGFIDIQEELDKYTTHLHDQVELETN